MVFRQILGKSDGLSRHVLKEIREGWRLFCFIENENSDGGTLLQMSVRVQDNGAVYYPA
jgi:hypothetical protein